MISTILLLQAVSGVNVAPATPSAAAAMAAPMVGSNFSCAAKTAADAKRPDPPTVTVFPAGDASAFAKQGFAPVSCATVDLAAYRDTVCKIAAVPNVAVAKRAAVLLGADPKKICASLKSASISVPEIVPDQKN